MGTGRMGTWLSGAVGREINTPPPSSEVLRNVS